MSIDLDRVLALLRVVKEAAQHPAKLAPLGQLAMKELEGHSAEAKEEHDAIVKKEKEEADAKQLEEFNKRQAAIAKEKEEAEANAKAKAEGDAKAQAALAAKAEPEDTRPTPSWELPTRRRTEETA